MATEEEIEEFIRDVLKMIPREEQNSPDITLLVFQMIENKSALFGSRYRGFGGDSSLNREIGKKIKALLGREDDKEILSNEKSALIKNYMRFKPIP